MVPVAGLGHGAPPGDDVSVAVDDAKVSVGDVSGDVEGEVVTLQMALRDLGGGPLQKRSRGKLDDNPRVTIMATRRASEPARRACSRPMPRPWSHM